MPRRSVTARQIGGRGGSRRNGGAGTRWGGGVAGGVFVRTGAGGVGVSQGSGGMGERIGVAWVCVCADRGWGVGEGWLCPLHTREKPVLRATPTHRPRRPDAEVGCAAGRVVESGRGGGTLLIRSALRHRTNSGPALSTFCPQGGWWCRCGAGRRTTPTATAAWRWWRRTSTCSSSWTCSTTPPASSEPGPARPGPARLRPPGPREPGSGPAAPRCRDLGPGRPALSASPRRPPRPAASDHQAPARARPPPAARRPRFLGRSTTPCAAASAAASAAAASLRGGCFSDSPWMGEGLGAWVGGRGRAREDRGPTGGGGTGGAMGGTGGHGRLHPRLDSRGLYGRPAGPAMAFFVVVACSLPWLGHSLPQAGGPPPPHLSPERCSDAGGWRGAMSTARCLAD